MGYVSLGPWPLGQDDQHLLSDEVYQRRESAKGAKPARARRLENWTLLEDGTLLTGPGARLVHVAEADLRASISWQGLWLVQIGTALYRVTAVDPWTIETLVEGLEEPAVFCPWDDQTLFWMAGAARGRVDAEGVPSHWGVALPPAPDLNTTTGTAPAGRYLVTWRYFDAEGRVSGAPEAQAQILDGDQELVLAHTGAVPVGAVGVEVFVSGADQETLMYHDSVDLEDLPVTLTLGAVPAIPDPLDTLLLDPPPVGEGMCPFGNVLLIWSGDTLYPSQPRDPSLWDWQEGTQFDDPIRQVVEVADGGLSATFYANTSNGWEQIGKYTAPTNLTLKAPWFFSPTGDKASTIGGYDDKEDCLPSSWWITDYEFVTAHLTLTDGRITLSFEEEHKVYDSLEPSETRSTSSSTLPAQCEVVDDWRLFPITAPVYGDIVYLTELGTKYWEIVDYNIAQADARYPSLAPFWADDVEVANQSIADMLQYIEDTYPCPSCDRQYNPLQVGGAELRDKNNTFWDTIGMSFFIARETLNHGIVTRAEEFAERTAGGARPVAIDYGFDGEKLLVEQYRTQLLANFHETLDEHTATRCTHLDDGQYYFGTGVSITEQYINWTWETELVSSWSMKINGTNWLSISGESSFTEQSEIVTIAGEQTVTSSGAGTANYELVYLMDCDARTKSLIYTHTQMSETFESAPESQTFNGSQIWKQADRKMVALHGAATHNFNEGTFTKTFDIGEGGYYSPLYTGQCFMHHNNENVEGNYCPEDECLFAGQTKRYVGSLCVRSPEATAFSFSNESGKITFGEAEGEKEELKYASRVLLKDVLTDPVPELERELDADLVADDFRIRPIRAF